MENERLRERIGKQKGERERVVREIWRGYKERKRRRWREGVKERERKERELELRSEGERE